MFLSEITAIQVEDSLIDSSGKLRLERARLAAYAHGDYYELGKRIGSFGFSVRKKKKSKRETACQLKITYCNFLKKKGRQFPATKSPQRLDFPAPPYGKQYMRLRRKDIQSARRANEAIPFHLVRISFQSQYLPAFGTGLFAAASAYL